MVTHMMRLAVAAVFVLPLTAAAQDKGASPLAGATEPGVDKRATLVTEPRHADAEFERLLAMLCGSFRGEGRVEGTAQGADGTAALQYGAARITVEGLDNAVYFEITREDSPLSPFRQGVFHLYRAGKELRLRVLDFRAGKEFTDAVAGLWAAPKAFPAVTLAQLDPNLDLVIRSTSNGASGRTAHMFPTAIGSAVEMTSSIEIGTDRLALHDVGYDAQGVEAWGGDGTKPTEFVRQSEPWYGVVDAQGGLVIIRARKATDGASAQPVVQGGEIAMHFTAWLADGTRFNSTRQTGREPAKLRVPEPSIKWNEGLKGIGMGELRKLVIPPELAYGERGDGRGVIPPNATLIFEIECMFVDNANPVAPAPPPLVNPHGGAAQPGARPPGAGVPPGSAPGASGGH